MQKDNQFSKVLKIDAERYAPCGMRSIPYGRQWIDEEDIKAVINVLRSDWLTTGPLVSKFEETFADSVDAKEAVAVSSGTAALHAAMYALKIGPGDEVIVPPMTFAATANCVVFQGGIPVFADVDQNILLLDPDQVEAKITPRTKAIIAVDYTGHPCDYDALRSIAGRNKIALVADACHALGAGYKGHPAGSLADLNVFSFHPVKHITTGEGGMITTNDSRFAVAMRTFRNHGITRDPSKFVWANEKPQNPILQAPCALPFYYEMVDLGYNYRLTDFQCALGMSQLRKLPGWIDRRREIAVRYDEAIADIPGIDPLGLRADVLPAKHFAKQQTTGDIHSSSDAMRYVYPVESLPNGIRSPFHRGEGHSTGAPSAMPSTHAYHLYVIRIDSNVLGIDRTTLFTNLREKGIGVNVHYIPVHLHPFYREKFHTAPGFCPVAEKAYEQIISIPMFPEMTDEDVERVISAIIEVTSELPASKGRTSRREKNETPCTRHSTIGNELRDSQPDRAARL